MDFRFSDEQEMFRKSVRDYVHRELPKSWARELEKDEHNFPHELSDENLLGQPDQAWKMLLPTLNNERIMLSAFCVGILDGVLEDALRYVQEREAFGRKIGEFQALQHYIANVAMWQEQAELIVTKAAWLQSRGLLLTGPAGHELPPGSARLEPYQNWLLHDAFYSPPRPEPHPVAAFVLANRGIGISLADLFALFGSDINDGPLLAESSIELHRPLAEDAEYQVRGVIESVERRQSRRIGPFDRITCRFDLLQSGDLAATVTNVFAIPRPGQDGTP